MLGPEAGIIPHLGSFLMGFYPLSVTLEKFVEDLGGSGIISAKELSALKDRCGSDEPPSDSMVLAKELIKTGRLTKFQAKTVLQGNANVLSFGQYTVLDRIGAGGMGVVFKAAVVCVVEDLQAFAAFAAECKVPVIAYRPLEASEEFDDARAACDRLQRDLAGGGDYAGYMV